MNELPVKPQLPKRELILASQSPRRKELLSQLGFMFSVQASDIDETVKCSEAAGDYVLRLATEKAKHVFNLLPDKDKLTNFVLGSDTSVIFRDKILGKPESEADCLNMLTMLSNAQHQVITAVALVDKKNIASELVTTQVTFKELSKEEILAYWLTGEPQDKAGSYGIQGIASQFVKNISGSYSAVVGLPLYETAKLLHQAGFTGAIDVQNGSK